MAIRMDDFANTLPADLREEIEAGTRELIAEEYSLRELRAARDRSQQQIAERLGVNQAAVSKLERRADAGCRLCPLRRPHPGFDTTHNDTGG